MNTVNFVCEKCGMCCKTLQHISDLSKFDRGDGVCIYLKDNLCSIYENRPLLCNVSEMYNNFFKTSMSAEEFIFVNKQACKQINLTFFKYNYK